MPRPPAADSARALLLAGAVLLAYANALGGSFQFDDYNVIADNPAVQSWHAWLASMPGIRPLLKLSYLLNWRSGWGAPGFHLINLLCHLGSTLLVYALGRRLLGGPHAGAIALTVALLFALHPAQTEAVTYICGRSSALMGLFYLGAALAYFDTRPLSRLLLSPLLFVLALLSKETAWTLPLALLLLERMRGSDWHSAAQKSWPLWLTLALGAGALAGIAGYRRLLANSLSIRSTLDNLLLQIDGIYYLITRPLLTLHTNIDPDLPFATDGIALLWRMAALAILLAAGVLQLRQRPWLGGSLLWFFLHLLPTNSLLPRQDVANDRQLYLALLGPALIVAVVVWRALAARPARALTAALALTLGIATTLRNRDYASEVTLWQATAATSPAKARVWNNLGYAQQLAGDRDGARRSYEKALALEPEHIRARFNLRALE